MYFGGKTYNSIIIGGSTATSTFSIGNEASTGPTFSDISSAKSVAHTIQFPVGQTTTTGTFNVAGSPGNLVTISTYGGAGHTLAKTGGGTISSDYLSITGSNATPANTWYAGSNSIDGGGNTGWIFPTSPSNFLMFFS